MATLKRQLARVKEERGFLRDAAAFFARESSRSIRRTNAVAVSILSN
jgi:transposase